MAVIGVAILAYALYSYISFQILEARLEAQVPGQSSNIVPSTTSVALLPASNSDAANVPTLDGTGISPSVTPFPTPATPVQPDSTVAANLALTPSPTHAVTGTATAISLARTTPLPTDELTNLLSKPKPSATPTILLSGLRVPTPASGIPTIDASAPRALGVPRGTGSPAARLQIPKLGMDLPVIAADYATYQQGGQLISDWNIPYGAAGHLTNSAQPGEIGNAVLSGHHNLTAPNTFGLGAFAGLWNLVQGDEVRVERQDGKTELWRVAQSFPVKEAGEPLQVRIQHAEQILRDTPNPTLTLLTCWNGKSNPLSGNTYRWVVQAELVNVN